MARGDGGKTIFEDDDDRKVFIVNPLFPALRSGHRLFQRPSPQKQIPSSPLPPVATSPRLPASNWIRCYREALRKRLPLLPYEYAFAIQQAIHQLEGVCDRIACFMWHTGADMDELGTLVQDIYGHTLRGMVLSVVGLSWHMRGVYLGPECEQLRDKAIKIISKLRSDGPISKNDLLKNFHLRKEERDALLQQLTEENLLRVDGKQVLATTYSEFVERLHAREDLPPVVSHWEERCRKGRRLLRRRLPEKCGILSSQALRGMPTGLGPSRFMGLWLAIKPEHHDF